MMSPLSRRQIILAGTMSACTPAICAATGDASDHQLIGKSVAAWPTQVQNWALHGATRT